MKITTYEDWLALNDLQRRSVAEKWNAYKGEGLGFAHVAAGRLAIASSIPVLHIRVGIYHGGEYILNLFVDDKVIATMPMRFEQNFEGFRVGWRPYSQLDPHSANP